MIKALIKKFERLPKKFKGGRAVQGGHFKFLMYTVQKMKRFCCIIKEVICFAWLFPHVSFNLQPFHVNNRFVLMK